MMNLLTLPAGLIALCLATLAGAADNVCYFPNGTPSSDVPCRSDPSTAFSMCCSSATACLPSGLCKTVSTNGTSADADKFIRATCTDPSWASDVCPPYCLSRPGSPGSGSNSTSTAFNLNLTQNDVLVRHCPKQMKTGQAATFCCDLDKEGTSCCGQADVAFELSILASMEMKPLRVVHPADDSANKLSAAAAPLSVLSPASALEPIHSSAAPEAPVPVPTSALGEFPTRASQPAAQTSAGRTTADPSAINLSVPSTNPPSTVSLPTVAATSTPDSGIAPANHPPNPAQAVAVLDTERAGSTSGGSSISSDSSSSSPSGDHSGDKSGDNSNNGVMGMKGTPNGSTSNVSTWEKVKKSRLSTGAVAGIGLGASLAAAGLVTILVYMFARRRLFMKRKRWEADMLRAVQKPDYGGDSGGDRMSLPPGMVAVQTQTADGKPAVVMLTQAQVQQGMMQVLMQKNDMLMVPGGRQLDMEAPSPVSVRDVRNLAWDARSVSEYSSDNSRRNTRLTTVTDLSRQNSVAVSVLSRQNSVATTPVPQVAPAALRGERTVTWYARHSVYEMG